LRVDDGAAELREIVVTAPDVESPVDQLVRRLVAALVLIAVLVVASLILLWRLRKWWRRRSSPDPTEADSSQDKR
jgi:hypothetical protein